MDLYDYFYKLKKETGLEMREFAAILGISNSYLSTLVNKRSYPGFKMAKKIEKGTNGEVTMLDFMKERDNPKKIPINTSKRNNRKKRKDKVWEGEQLDLKL